MLKVILMFCLLLAGNSVQAAWNLVTSNEEANIYADTSTISKSVNIVKMWDITDFKQKIAAANHASIKSQREYDCKDKKNRALSYATMSKNMAGGAVVKSSNFARPWAPVFSGGVVGALWAAACAKR